jgi:peroxiredoxin
MLKKVLTVFLTLVALTLFAASPQPLEIGAKAPDFSLEGVDGKTYSLDSFDDAKILVMVFTANHCPTAQAYEDRLIELARDYSSKNVAVVAISPNDPRAVRLDELGYTDLGDDLKDMKLRAKEKKFNFPYLYDGETQRMSKAYGPVSTPHVFIFDQERILRYSGRIDDSENPAKVTSRDARNAIDALLAGKKVRVAKTKTFGCSIKWADKRDGVQKTTERWENEPVKVDMVDLTAIKTLIANKTENLRLVNLWATWCGPCVAEFDDLVEINRMYRNRNFEMVTISADKPDHHDKVLTFLEKKHASMNNKHFDSENVYDLIEAVDPDWQGGLPYTMIIEPGGQVIYTHQGAIDPLEVKKTIVESLGRYYF